jgi:hypothetical protein
MYWPVGFKRLTNLGYCTTYCFNVTVLRFVHREGTAVSAYTALSVSLCNGEFSFLVCG